jgi:hypothetical protein
MKITIQTMAALLSTKSPKSIDIFLALLLGQAGSAMSVKRLTLGFASVRIAWRRS